MRSKPRRPSRLATAFLALLLPACHGSDAFTAPGQLRTPADVAHFRDIWLGEQLSDYDYETETTGFFIAFAGQRIRVTVRGDTVRSASFAASGDPVPYPLTSFPTITGLYDFALTAAGRSALVEFEVDPVLAYPRRLVIAGPPDASGAVTTADLRPVR